MNIFQLRKLTDAEFVEKVRKQLQKNRRWAWAGLVASGSFLGLFIWFSFLFIGISHLGSEGGEKHHSDFNDWYQAGFKLGAILGAFAMLLLVKVFWYFCEFLIWLAGNRRDKLLVACYDQLHPLDTKAPAPSSAEKFPHRVI